jgi:cystathionine beta-lyase/cystathionine gamma-synthase
MTDPADERTDTRSVAGAPAPITLPIYETTTYLFDNAAEVVAYNEGRSDRFLYTRYGNPTVAAVEADLAALDGAEGALLFASGMAATATTIMAHTSAGDEVVCAASIYGGTLHLLTDLLARFGVTPRFVSLDELAAPDALITKRTRLLWFESPTNPTLRCVDIRAVTAACRTQGVLSVLDNTFASPINQRPLDLGADLSMQSATKYLNGHSDVTAGVVSGPAALLSPIEKARRLLGGILDAQPAYALGRGLKTLAVRIARHNATAQAVAETLARDSRVSAVFYPGLPDHPDHAVARAQMSGFGGMVCIDLGGDYARAARAFDRFRVIRRAASLGGVESLVSMPVLTSQWGYTDEQLRAAGVTRGMLRLSIGLEEPAALLADLDQALA